MAAHAQNEHGTEPAGPVDFDAGSKKGWQFFTKFVFWNVIVIIAVLLLIGVFTVWS